MEEHVSTPILTLDDSGSVLPKVMKVTETVTTNLSQMTKDP